MIIINLTDGGLAAIGGGEEGTIQLLINKIEYNYIINNYYCKSDDLILIRCLIHQQNTGAQV